MNTYRKFLCGVLVVVLAGTAFRAHAAITPTVSFSTISNSSSYMISITGDPDAIITLFSSNPSTQTAGAPVQIGSTDQNGGFSTTVNPGSYGVPTGASVYVTVDGLQSSTVAWPSFGAIAPSSSNTLSLSETNVTLAVGQSVVVGTSADNGLAVSVNSNPSVASTLLNGNEITITGLSYGTTNLNVCADGTSCQTIYVTVGSSSTSSTTSGISFGQNTASLSVGQTTTIPIYGSGGYYVSSNSSSNIVSAVINGTGLYLTGISAGSSNINVCQSGGECGVVYVSVSTAGQVVPTSVPAAALTSFTISSNNANGAFMNSGDVLTFSFTTNQTVNNASISIAGSSLGVTGSGTGPYTSTYSIPSSETLPLPAVISFTDLSGNYHQLGLSVGVSGLATTATANSSASLGCLSGNAFNTISGAPCAGSSSVSSSSTPSPTGYQFANPLNIGSTGADVTALQKRLTADGLYSGPISGYYGTLTQSAVKEYQTKHSIEALGNVGPSTRALLNQGV